MPVLNGVKNNTDFILNLTLDTETLIIVYW